MPGFCNRFRKFWIAFIKDVEGGKTNQDITTEKVNNKKRMLVCTQYYDFPKIIFFRKNNKDTNMSHHIDG